MSSQLPTVIVLASGRGERFLAAGGGSHKLRALLAGREVLQHTLAAVRASGLPWHLEQAGHAGMGDSIAAAVRATADASGWLILPGDLPLVQPATLLRVAQELCRHEVVLPLFEGRRGHPVGFARACGVDLQALTGDQGAASVVRAHHAFQVAVSDEGAVTDIDTPADLARAEQLLQQRMQAPQAAAAPASLGQRPAPGESHAAGDHRTGQPRA